MNRRQFLQAVAAAGVAVTCPHVVAFAAAGDTFTAADVERMKTVYVDPAAKVNGNGLIDKPYNSLEQAMINTTFDAKRGVRINIKASPGIIQ